MIIWPVAEITNCNSIKLINICHISDFEHTTKFTAIYKPKFYLLTRLLTRWLGVSTGTRPPAAVLLAGQKKCEWKPV